MYADSTEVMPPTSHRTAADVSSPLQYSGPSNTPVDLTSPTEHYVLYDGRRIDGSGEPTADSEDDESLRQDAAHAAAAFDAMEEDWGRVTPDASTP